MPTPARVFRILIASPSDTAVFRHALRESLWELNSVAVDDGIIFLPLMWESDAVPEVGEAPQAIINRQLVAEADVLLGIFWTRLGTPTAEAESGTAEEINRFVESGRPALLYRSNALAGPEDLDLAELKRLETFLEDMKRRALIQQFKSAEELQRRAIRDLTRTMNKRFLRTSGAERMPRFGEMAPMGRLDFVVWRDEQTRTAVVDGWTLDPLQAESTLPVELMLNGALLVSGKADSSRPDVGRRFHLGDNHGYAIEVQIPQPGLLEVVAITERGRFVVASAEVA
jgi:hypothetical protein